MGYLGKGLASVLILTIMVSSLSLLMVKPANAQTSTPSAPQFYVTQSPPTINIESPANYGEYGLNIPLKFTINYIESDPSQYIWGHSPIWVGYSIDNQPYATINSSLVSTGGGHLRADILLDSSALSDGPHEITVKADFMYLIEQVNAGHYNYTFPSVSFGVSKSSIDLMAESNTINPEVKYTIYKPSPNETYTNTMMIDFYYDVSYKDSGVESLGLSNYYSIDKGENQSFPTHGYVKVADISTLSNGTHELTVYIDAPYVYNSTIFPNTFQLFSTNFTVLNLSPATTSSVPELSWLAILPLLLSMLSIAVILKVRKYRTPERICSKYA